MRGASDDGAAIERLLPPGADLSRVYRVAATLVELGEPEIVGLAEMLRRQGCISGAEVEEILDRIDATTTPARSLGGNPSG